jgi:hypothetical protein
MFYVADSHNGNRLLPGARAMFSFRERRKAVDLQKYVRRIADVTTPNSGMTAECLRSQIRYNRTIPTLLCPWYGDRVDCDRCAMVLTKDLCDRGVGLITHHPFPGRDVVLGFWLPYDDNMQEPWFFRGTIQREVPIGGGFWWLGVELAEFMNERWRVQLGPLLPMAQKLVPPLTTVACRQQDYVAEPSGV